jgi:outer membrane protein assembly factor BamE (lipoprotein component of BamABCDE complex)
MKMLLNLAVATLLAVSLSGCVVVGGNNWNDDDGWQKRQIENKRVISQLELNDSRTQIIEQLGAPDFSEAFSKGKEQYRILFYRTQRQHSDGETSKDETTPLVFKNDLLIGWGEDALMAVK